MSSHSAERYLPYAPCHLFDLVADVERYSEFVPWWVAASVWKRQDNVYYTRQVVGLPFLRQEFQSQTTLHRPEHIAVNSVDRPFRSLTMDWYFIPLADGGTKVQLKIDFEFRAARCALLGSILSGEGIRRLIDAFEGRARQLSPGRPFLLPLPAPP